MSWLTAGRPGLLLRYNSMSDYDEDEVENYLKSRRLKAVKLPVPPPPEEDARLE